MKNVSMVIPVKNEELTVQRLIDSIAVQMALPSEAIFIDGGSTDRTKVIIEDSIGKLPFEIKLIETEKAYPGQARNIGIKAASGELIAFTDAGIVLDKMWLEELLRPMEVYGVMDVVYGAYEPVIDSFIKECSLIAYIPPKEEVGGKLFRTNFIASSIFRRSAIEKAGPFPPFRAAEDRIFMENVKRSGAKICYTDKAIVYWYVPASILGIFRRFCEFSRHDLAAGRARDWHISVFRTYAVLLSFLALGFLVDKWLLLGIPLAWSVRMASVFLKRKTDIKTRYVLDPRYFFTVTAIVAITDIAMFCGAVEFILAGRHEIK